MKRFTGTGWSAVSLILNGDMLTPGTVKGDRIVAGTEITSPLISAGTGEFSGTVNAKDGSFLEKVEIGSAGGYKAYIKSVTSSGYNIMWVENPIGDVMFAVQGNGNIYSIGGGYMNNLTIGEDCNILGVLKANQIQGELVVGKTYSTAAVTATSASWVSFASVEVTTAEEFDRTLEVNVLLSGNAYRSGNGNSGNVVAKVKARMTGDFGTVTTDQIETQTAYHAGQGGTTEVSLDRQITMMVTVPANTKGSMALQVQLVTGSGDYSAAKLSGTCGTQWIARIFRNGSGLS
uniref:Uncharacterized protein n=2 Tax=Vibrio ziniensis TaxID=2711221 RepID=A0A6G7CM67_9VIBR|nr:hypothetical protein G5S32_05380 [Vibrio ziniensis]